MSEVGSSGGGEEMLMEGGRGGGEFAKSKTVNNCRKGCRDNELAQARTPVFLLVEERVPEGDGDFIIFINLAKSNKRNLSHRISRRAPRRVPRVFLARIVRAPPEIVTTHLAARVITPPSV